MRDNSLKPRLDDVDLPATARGPKPGDFPLGSVESRAAARAIVDQRAQSDGPQPGEVVVDLGFLATERAVEIYRLIRSIRELRRPDRIPGQPMIWFKFTFPEGFDPDSVLENTPPLTFENASDDLLRDVIRCHNEALRQAEQKGPPEL